MGGFPKNHLPHFFICLYFIGVGWNENLKKIGMALQTISQNICIFSRFNFASYQVWDDEKKINFAIRGLTEFNLSQIVHRAAYNCTTSR